MNAETVGSAPPGPTLDYGRQSGAEADWGWWKTATARRG
jgi:hypothetical protein